MSNTMVRHQTLEVVDRVVENVPGVSRVDLSGLKRIEIVELLIKMFPGISDKELMRLTGIPRRSLYKTTKDLVYMERVKKLESLKDARMFKYYAIT